MIRGKRCLITGGAGFIGSTIADHLIAAKAKEVIILDDLSRGRLENVPQRARFAEGDIRDGKLVRKLMAGVDYVFHQAAVKILQCAAEPRFALDVMANGTFEVFEAARDLGVRKVVAASSASVYGLAEEFPTNESHHPYANETFYGAAKLFTEGMAASLGLDCVMLRYFNVYGPRMDVHGAYTEVLPRWMDRIKAGESLLIDGDGGNTRDFTYVTDVARANLLAAVSDATGIFNIGSGTETSLSELAGMLIRITGSDVKPEYRPPRSVDPVPRRLADITAAREQFGWEPEVDLETGLRNLVAWRA